MEFELMDLNDAACDVPENTIKSENYCLYAVGQLGFPTSPYNTEVIFDL